MTFQSGLRNSRILFQKLTSFLLGASKNIHSITNKTIGPRNAIKCKLQMQQVRRGGNKGGKDGKKPCKVSVPCSEVTKFEPFDDSEVVIEPKSRNWWKRRPINKPIKHKIKCPGDEKKCPYKPTECEED